MTEINLLKNEFQKTGLFSFGAKGLTSLYIVLGILGLELLLLGGLFFYQMRSEAQARGLEQQAAEVDLEIERFNPSRKTAVSFQRRLNNLQVLLDRHVFWTQAFAEFSKYTLKTVRLRTLEVSEADGVFTVTGAAPSYTDLGKFILGLRQSPNISDVTIKTSSESQSGEGGLDFNAEIMFNTKLLSPSGGPPEGRQK